jgi:hypothetical protein
MLEGDERSAFEHHLGVCPACHRIVEQDRRTVDNLSALAPEQVPGSQLKAQLMQAAASDPGSRAAPGRLEPAHRARPERRRAGLVLAAVAGICLLCGGLLGYHLALDQILLSVPLEGPAGSNSEVLVRRSGAAAVELRGLPDPPPGQLYVVWLKSPLGSYESVGTYDDGNGSCPLDRPVLGGSLVLTVEPVPIPVAPTGPHLLWATVQASSDEGGQAIR